MGYQNRDSIFPIYVWIYYFLKVDGSSPHEAPLTAQLSRQHTMTKVFKAKLLKKKTSI